MTKKQIAIGLAVLLLIIAGTTLIPVTYPPEDEESYHGVAVAGMYGVQNIPEITLATTLPRYPEQAMVYRTVDTPVSKDDALKMAEKFGLTGSVEEKIVSYRITGDPYMFNLDKGGGYLIYTWDGRCSGVDPRDRPENLPTDEECRKIAEAFLTSHDLMPEGAVFSSIAHGEGFASNAAKNISIATYKDSRVLFTDTLSGLRVAGSGIAVTVGGGGDILEVSRRWRDVEPYKEFVILSPEEAIEELKQTGVVTTVSSPKGAVVEEVKLCYYATPPGTEQPYLKPTYYFHGTMEGENETGTFYQYIPAVPELGKGLY